MLTRKIGVDMNKSGPQNVRPKGCVGTVTKKLGQAGLGARNARTELMSGLDRGGNTHLSTGPNIASGLNFASSRDGVIPS